MLYMASWGTTRLVVRLPEELVDPSRLQAYCIEDIISIKSVPGSVLLDIEFNDENGCGWIEDSDQLSDITEVRAMLIAGDYRPLYLIWLKAALWQLIYEGRLNSAIVPVGLSSLEPALQALAELFEVSSDLISAAAQYSQPQTHGTPLRELNTLSPQECVSWLQRLLDREPLLAEKLTRQLSSPEHEQIIPEDIISIDQLVERAKQEKSERLAYEAEMEHKKRVAYLTEFALRREQHWKTAIGYIEQKHASAYKKAVTILVDLSDVAKLKQEEALFSQKMTKLINKYSNRSALKSRLKAAGLI